mmetsp:Transcript_13164/g.14627  ORF Transcript_13164/g.14627 Transcript_13164/m.14627 type:complete len:85 (+) Transcript_13164:157-411(+)
MVDRNQLNNYLYQDRYQYYPQKIVIIIRMIIGVGVGVVIVKGMVVGNEDDRDTVDDNIIRMLLLLLLHLPCHHFVTDDSHYSFL